MAIPDFQTLMLPLLELAADGNGYSMQDARDQLARKFSVTEEEQNTLLPSGRQPVFSNRVGWAKSYLTQAGALDASRRGFFRISERGRGILREKPQRITVKFLERFPEFIEFRAPQAKHEEEVSAGSTVAEDKQTPMLDAAYQRLRHDTAGSFYCVSRNPLQTFSST